MIYPQKINSKKSKILCKTKAFYIIKYQTIEKSKKVIYNIQNV